MRAILTGAALLALLSCAAEPPASSVAAWDYQDLDQVLLRHVGEDGRVDYSGLANDRAGLERYVAALGMISPDSHPDQFPDEADRLAYWMNAYNALMLLRVVEAWPIESVKEIKLAYGVFWRERHVIGGESWTLRGLENKIIRDRFGEPRIHFGINCASEGCPALPRRAWRAETLDADLDTAARRFIRDQRNVRIDAAARVVYLSSIFKWFDEDFTGSLAAEPHAAPRGILDYVRLYLPAESSGSWDPAHWRVEYVDYDWSINVQQGDSKG